jgi:bifunctional ADP-heptose synthase (sugar kinase/adenylyltransferase)
MLTRQHGKWFHSSRAYLHDRPEREVVRRWVDRVHVALDEDAVVEDLHKGRGRPIAPRSAEHMLITAQLSLAGRV